MAGGPPPAAAAAAAAAARAARVRGGAPPAQCVPPQRAARAGRNLRAAPCRHRGRAPSHSPASRSELLEGCAGLLRCTQTLQAEFARLCCFRRLSRRPQRDGLPHVERRALYERLERLRQATASAEVAVLRRTATQSTDEQERSVNWTWHEVVGVRSTPGVRPLAISAEWVGGGCLRAPQPLIVRGGPAR